MYINYNNYINEEGTIEYEKHKNKLLLLIFSGIFTLALQSHDLVSNYHIYQEKQPNSLKKYKIDKKER